MATIVVTSKIAVTIGEKLFELTRGEAENLLAQLNRELGVAKQHNPFLQFGGPCIAQPARDPARDPYPYPQHKEFPPGTIIC